MDDIPDINTNADASGNYDYTTSHHSELVRFLTESQDMRNTAKSSLKQSMFAGGAAFAGSMIAGPVGGLVGGVAGSVIGFLNSDDYDGAVKLIMDLESERHQILMKEVGGVLMAAGASVRELRSDEIRNTLQRFMNNDNVRNKIWSACMSSIRE